MDDEERGPHFRDYGKEPVTWAEAAVVWSGTIGWLALMAAIVACTWIYWAHQTTK